MTTRYKIIRHFFNERPSIIIKKGLTYDDALEHCNNPETSSTSCISTYRRAYTRKNGPWFDGFISYNTRR